MNGWSIITNEKMPTFGSMNGWNIPTRKDIEKREMENRIAELEKKIKKIEKRG
jgi:hypothetical protein